MKPGIIFFLSILVILTYLSNNCFAQNSLNNNIYKDENNIVKVPLSLMSKPIPPDINPLETEIDYPFLAVMGGITIGIGISVHIYQANAWWQNQSSKFKFQNDWNYALWLDKMGHFYATAFMSHALASGFEAANLDLERSAIYGAIGAFSFELFLEIEDGFGPQWGFSPGDLGADFLGALYTVGQYYYPTLKHIQPRASYYPSKKYRDGEHKGTVSDDYTGQKYWLGFRMKSLLPKSIAEYWPSFLMLSVGMGLSNWDGYGGGQQEIFIAFDFDAETLPLHGPVWQFIKNTLNYFHFPMPGIRISPSGAAFSIVY